MLKIIREILLKIVNDIDTGNSNLSPEECMYTIWPNQIFLNHLLLANSIYYSLLKIT